MEVFFISNEICLHNLMYIVVKKIQVININFEYLIFGIDIKLKKLNLMIKLNKCGMVTGKIWVNVCYGSSCLIYWKFQTKLKESNCQQWCLHAYRIQNKHKHLTGAHSELNQRFNTDLITKTANSWKPWTIFLKKPHLRYLTGFPTPVIISAINKLKFTENKGRIKR